MLRTLKSLSFGLLLLSWSTVSHADFTALAAASLSNALSEIVKNYESSQSDEARAFLAYLSQSEAGPVFEKYGFKRLNP